MIEIIPAIDIIDGKCVRLSQGDYQQKKVYNEQPLEVAKEFADAGIRRLHVFAWQFVTDWRLGNAIPFQMLTTIGGNQLLRGIPSDLFRDNVMAALQGEYRFPIYKMLRGAVFASSGDVLNSNDLMINRLKTSYGAGIRFKIIRGKINVSGRWDITHTNVDKGVQFFLTAMEAF